MTAKIFGSYITQTERFILSDSDGCQIYQGL
jgi:hypothetical protein